MDDENEFKQAIPPKKSNLGSTILVPFLCGVAGASLVMGVCFGIPQFREELLKSSNASVPTYSTIDKTEKDDKDDKNDKASLIRLSDTAEVGPTVASKVLPSIVGIKVTYNVSSFWGSSTGEASGSGIIISEDGYIITNNHVVSTESSSSAYYEVSKATSLKVKLYNDDKEYDAKVIGTDAYTDIAVIKIEANGLTPAKLGNSDELKVGEFVMALGNPIGMDFTVTQGIVSAINREVKMDDGTTYVAIQTDAAINSGNSGGALVNSNGEVIGINSLKISGSGIEGISFAIPISSATDIIDQLIDHQNVTRPYIGISGESISSQVAEIYGLPQGIYIKKVYKDSPAEKAGIKEGDVVIKIEGKGVTSIAELNRVKNTFKIGDTVTLTLLRSGKEEEVKVTLVEEPEKTTVSDENSEKQDSKKDSRENSRDEYDDFWEDDFFGGSIWDFFR